MLWEPNGKTSKFDSKGLSLVRRDATVFGKTIGKDAIVALFETKSPDKSMEIIVNACRHLVEEQRRIFSLGELVPSTSYTEKDRMGNGIFKNVENSKSIKNLSSYTNTEALPHVRVVENMEKRMPGSAPRAGDRVPYVITIGKTGDDQKERLADRAEDPSYAFENKIPLDLLWVLRTQIIKPLGDFLKWSLAKDGGSNVVKARCLPFEQELIKGNMRMRAIFHGNQKPIGTFFNVTPQGQETKNKNVFKIRNAVKKKPKPPKNTLNVSSKVGIRNFFTPSEKKQKSETKQTKTKATGNGKNTSTKLESFFLRPPPPQPCTSASSNEFDDGGIDWDSVDFDKLENA